MLSIDLEVSDFHALVGRTLDEIEHGMEHAVRRAAELGAEEARRSDQFKDRTGELRRNITARPVESSHKGCTWEIVSPMPYSRFVEEGTRPHAIFGNPDLVFFWEKHGRWVRTDRVNHPGTQPHVFMGIGYLKAERVLWVELELMMRTVERVWEQAA